MSNIKMRTHHTIIAKILGNPTSHEMGMLGRSWSTWMLVRFGEKTLLYSLSVKLYEILQMGFLIDLTPILDCNSSSLVVDCHVYVLCINIVHNLAWITLNNYFTTSFQFAIYTIVKLKSLCIWLDNAWMTMIRLCSHI